MSSMSETNESKRRCRVCENFLHPLTGGLKCRLNRLISHWPVSTSSVQHYCQLCYWLTGKRKYKSVVGYKTCNVVLCTDDCYKVFHTKWEIDKNGESTECEINFTTKSK